MQYERDIKQAKRLQASANRDADLRSTANALLDELKPTYDKFFSHAFHGEINLRGERISCKEYDEICHDLEPLIERCGYLVARVGDQALLEQWKIFEEAVNSRRAVVLITRNQEKSTWDNEMLRKEKATANDSLEMLLNRSEQLLAEA